MLIYALLGTSRPLSVSTTTTIAILTAAALGASAPNAASASLLTASATLTLLVGVILVVAAALRLGFVADFISEPVLIGFKAGIGLVIVLDQLPKLLGIHFSLRKGGGMAGRDERRLPLLSHTARPHGRNQIRPAAAVRPRDDTTWRP
jgi:MFS superfamily sulfate permease-like transporter